MMAKATFKITGMNDLKHSLNKLGTVPQRHVTASAKKGMDIVLKDAKANAPYDTGALKQGTVLKPERSSKKGKKVYRVVFDDKMNDTFQKKNAEGKVVAYYPVSQEYGYFTKNGRYVPGFRFIHNSMDKNAKAMAQKMVDAMKKKVDAEIRKAGLK